MERLMKSGVVIIIICIAACLIKAAKADRSLCESIRIVPNCDSLESDFEPDHNSLIASWKFLSWNKLTLWSTHKLSRNAKELVKRSNANNIAVSTLTCTTVNANLRGNTRNIALVGSREKVLTNLAFLLNQRSLPANSVMIVLNKVENMPDFNVTNIKQLNEYRGFYLLMAGSKDSASSALYHVFLAPKAEKVAFNKLPFKGGNSMSTFKITELDLQELPLRSITLDWTPWAKTIKCNGTKNCLVKGLLVDLIEIWTEVYNFTLLIDKQPDENWGTVPINGSSWPECQGLFAGLFGTVTKGDYDLGLSAWSTNVNRMQYVDMTSGLISNTRIVAFNILEPPLDLHLYFRPFTRHSWLCFIAFIILFSAFLTWLKYKFGHDSVSYQWSEFVIWLSFVVVINGYYCGALTMFFTSAPTVPFKTLEEGLRKYPEWKMIYPKGSDILIQPLAEAGIPEYAEYWNRIVNDPDLKDELSVPKDELMSSLLKPGYFLYGTSDYVMGAYSTYGVSLEKLQFHAVTQDSYQASVLVLAKNSPWTWILNDGLQRMRQTGQLDQLLKKWLPHRGRPLTGSLSAAADPVQIGQIAWALIGLSVATFLALVSFVVEKLVFRFNIPLL